MGKLLKNKIVLFVLSIFIAFIGLSFISNSAQALSLNLFSPQVNGRTVKLNGVARGNKGNFRWDWGDGTVERTWFPNSHTYSSGGSYTIRVTAYSGSGNSITRSKTVEIGMDWGGSDDSQEEESGEALSLNLYSPQVNGRSVKLNGVAEGNEDNFRWDWGDGTVEWGWFPNSHTYSSGGSYTIRVTASGNGDSITRIKNVEIDTVETADITVEAEDIADGTRLSFRIPSSITGELARGSVGDARVYSKIILEKIDNLPGGDMGISIASAIARGKIAWDLVASSRHYVDEYGYAVNWYYVIERHEDEWWCPEFLLPVVDKIASKWAEFSGTPAADIVGYASDSIDKIGQLEEVFLPVKSD